VLDEADLLLDLGFEPEIRRLIERSEMPTKEHRQTLMFSATFPMNVQELARNYMRDTYALVAIDQIGSANKCITQEFVEVSHQVCFLPSFLLNRCTTI
jgi:ATP-dependent RNA helicase DDX3X